MEGIVQIYIGSFENLNFAFVLKCRDLHYHSQSITLSTSQTWLSYYTIPSIHIRCLCSLDEILEDTVGFALELVHGGRRGKVCNVVLLRSIVQAVSLHGLGSGNQRIVWALLARVAHYLTLRVEDLSLWLVGNLSWTRLLLGRSWPVPLVFELFVLFFVDPRQHIGLGRMVMLGRQYCLLA